MCARLFVSRLAFPFVQPQISYCSFISGRESFQKIRGEKFECGSGLTHGLENLKISENMTSGDVWDPENALGSCAARNV